MDINPVILSNLEIYKILTGSILPRPIAWVSTIDATGRRNLAPFSFFTVASVNPPVLCFSPLINDECVEKDTLVNIRQTGEFVVNVALEEYRREVAAAGEPLPHGDSGRAGEPPETPHEPAAASLEPGDRNAVVPTARRFYTDPIRHL